MKASITTALGQGFSVHDIEIAAPQDREVLVEVRASGLCHSDLHLSEVDYGYPMPAVFGHEVAGVVEEVGQGVTTIRPGDHVVACLVSFCGCCEECIAGRTYACITKAPTSRTAGAEPRLAYGGSPLTQAHGIGGFAEKALIHENQLAVINRRIPFAPACIIGCGTVTGAGAVINTAGVRVGDSVAVIGAGGVGLNVISGARLAGALQIIAIDIDPTKLEAAARFGATHTIDASHTDPIEAVMDLTGRGVTHAFEVIGLRSTQQQALKLARAGGAVHLVGLASPGTTIEIPSSLEMLRAHTRIEAVHMGSTNLKRDIPMYVEFYLQGRLNLDDLVTQEISLTEIPAAYEQLKAGSVIRSVITSF